MRTITKIFSIILTMTLCLSAIAAPALAGIIDSYNLPLVQPNSGQVPIYCDTLNANTDSSTCNFNEYKFCNAELWEKEEGHGGHAEAEGDEAKLANALRWEFTLINRATDLDGNGQDIYLFHTQDPLCELSKAREVGEILPRGANRDSLEYDYKFENRNKDNPSEGTEYRIEYICHDDAIRYLANYVSKSSEGIPQNLNVEIKDLFCSEIR